MKTNKILIGLSILGILLIGGCSGIDYKELANDFCKEQGHNESTDYRGTFQPNKCYNFIYSTSDKYYIETDLKIECDNEKIYNRIEYYDNNRQKHYIDSHCSMLLKNQTSTCLEKDKWGSCMEYHKTKGVSKPKLIRR